MYVLRRLIRQHARMGLWALTLALLLSVGWGQVHRVLHPGALSFTSAEANARTTVPGLGDDDGSSLCKLLDQLTHGAGPVQALARLPAEPPAPLRWAPPVVRVQLAAVRDFDARGPPRLT
jgi:hypothetical protein